METYWYVLDSNPSRTVSDAEATLMVLSGQYEIFRYPEPQEHIKPTCLGYVAKVYANVPF